MIGQDRERMVLAHVNNRPGAALAACVRPALDAALPIGCTVMLGACVLLPMPIGAVCAVPALLSVLLAILLRRAQGRIATLERDRAAAIGQAGLDPLTTIADRASFERSLKAAIVDSAPPRSVALIAIDIDRFKSVNDTHGHLAGDCLLVAVVERIRGTIREGDCFARIGGDEFAVMLTHTDGAAQCADAARRILDAMVPPFDVGSIQLHASLSLGIAIGPQDGETSATLCHAADLALYRAKHEGRNRFAFFDKTMEQKHSLGQTIEDDLRRAIGSGELSVAYQPLIRASDGHMTGVEALVRWQHPTLGQIPPEDFIPLAEGRGLIVPLGEWVLRQACLDAKRWPDLRLAVNVSPVQFRQRGFVERVAAILSTTGTDPCRIDLELTEGVLIQDAEQAEAVIIDLRAMGIRMGLDDFGSGYSSMIYLRRFAFDKVKIDRAFLQSLETSGEGAIILEYIVSLGHALGLSVTAEGVEQEEQVAFLKKLGCDELQGFYFAAALPAREIDDRVSLATWTHAAPDVAAAISATPVVGRDAA